MEPVTTAAMISAGASLLGGLMGKKNADKANDMQREFAQQGIRWKVEDAKAAGIHPLYALGASTSMPSPISAGDYGISAAGQDISRAVMATRTQKEREGTVATVDPIVQQMAEENLRNVRLRNAILNVEHTQAIEDLDRSRLRRNLAQVGPPMPSALSGNVELKPSEQISADPNMPGRQAFKGPYGKPAMEPFWVGGKKHGFQIDMPNSNWPDIDGPAGWIMNAASIGGHYRSKFLDWIEKNYPAYREFHDGRAGGSRRSSGVVK